MQKSISFQYGKNNGITKRFKNPRDIIYTNVSHSRNCHCATFPQELIQPMILVGCPEKDTNNLNGIVLDPFFGTGTVGKVAKKLNRR